VTGACGTAPIIGGSTHVLARRERGIGMRAVRALVCPAAGRSRLSGCNPSASGGRAGTRCVFLITRRGIHSIMRPACCDPRTDASDGHRPCNGDFVLVRCRLPEAGSRDRRTDSAASGRRAEASGAPFGPWLPASHILPLFIGISRSQLPAGLSRQLFPMFLDSDVSHQPCLS
jgi:hypothetical protein